MKGHNPMHLAQESEKENRINGNYHNKIQRNRMDTEFYRLIRPCPHFSMENAGDACPTSYILFKLKEK